MNKKNILAISAFALIVVYLIYNVIRENKETKLLENSKTTYALVTKIGKGAFKTGPYGDFNYTLRNKTYKFSQEGSYYKFLKVGDTVLIEYAVKDPSVAKVKDRYYMQKYKHLKQKS